MKAKKSERIADLERRVAMLEQEILQLKADRVFPTYAPSYPYIVPSYPAEPLTPWPGPWAYEITCCAAVAQN
jgi:hypothetical protein